MKITNTLFFPSAISIAIMAMGSQVSMADMIEIGASGKTYASSTVRCAADPDTGVQSPVVDAGLFNPAPRAKALILLNNNKVGLVTSENPSASIWLSESNNMVVVSIKKQVADSYTFNIQTDMCSLPDTSGNTFSADGTIEYAESGKSYVTVEPGCALNPDVNYAQPFVNLFDNGSYLLNVSVNGIPFTQLNGTTRLHTPIFLDAGINVISADNGSMSTDFYIRDGGDGTCVLQ